MAVNLSRREVPPFHLDILRLDAAAEADRIVSQLRLNIESLGHEGSVVGVSGGVDSAVCLALAVQAFSPDRTIALLLPERESSPQSACLARQACRKFGVKPLVEDLTGALLGFNAYRRRDDAVRAVFPDYDETYRLKITLPSDLLEKETLNVFSATIVSPEGEEQKRRLRAEGLRQIVAATNFKQRSRSAMLYYYAELHNYAVIGTPPKNEHDLGFFVKFGDGAMDVKPIAHLYKSQVYQLAEHLEVPEAIRRATPTSDTYSAGSTQEEFFFRLPYRELDLLWYAWEHRIPAGEVALQMGFDEEQVERIYRDISRKIRSTRYLRTPPLPCAADSDSPGIEA
jgi:NAD+ synthase